MRSDRGVRHFGGALGRGLSLAIDAWRAERRGKAQLRRRRDETDFLPAALEILETPASPTARYTFWALTSLLAVGLIWSFVGELDVVAVSEGRTIPAGKTKVIQPLEAGVVRAIHVRDGQAVKTGDALVELDQTATGSDTRRLTADLIAARANVARLDAVAANPTAPQQHFRLPIGTPSALGALQLALLNSQTDEQVARLAALESEQRKREAERRSVETDIERIKKALPLLRERSAARTLLAEKGFGSKLTALELQQQQVEMEFQLAGLQHRREEALAAIEGLWRQKRQIQSQYMKDVLSERNELAQKASALEEELLKAEQRRGLQTLVAPLDGVVQQLAIHSLGGVVTPAQVLMAIVPDDATLEVEAMVQNRDIGFIRAGQPVNVKLETFLFTKYGTIPGEVISVSRDAVADEKKGLIYPIRIALDRNWIDVDGRRMELGAGLSLTAEIKTDRRRMIDYLLSPIVRYQQESLRER